MEKALSNWFNYTTMKLQEELFNIITLIILFLKIFLKLKSINKIRKFPVVLIECLLFLKKKFLRNEIDLSIYLSNTRLTVSSNSNYISSTIPLVGCFSQEVILDQEITPKRSVFKPFWNKISEETSKMLWLPAKTDGNFEKMEKNSWFSICQFKIHDNILQQSYYQSLTTFLLKVMNEDNIELKRVKRGNSRKKGSYGGVLITQKIKIKLSESQLETVKRWLGLCRKTYNVALESYNKKETAYDDLRDKFVSSTSDFFRDPKNTYLLDCPKVIREEMITKLKVSIDTNFRLLKESKIKKFDIKFKSRKEYKQTLPVPKSGFSKITKDNCINIFPRKLGLLKLKRRLCYV